MDGYAIVELLGHRRLVGQVSEVELVGVKQLRLDVPLPGNRTVAQFIAPAALFSLTPVTAESISDEEKRRNEGTLAVHDLLSTEDRTIYEKRLEDEAAARRARYSIPALFGGQIAAHAGSECDDESERVGAFGPTPDHPL